MQCGLAVHVSQALRVILEFIFRNSHSHSVLCNWSWSSKRLKMEIQMRPDQVKVGGKKWSCVCPCSCYTLGTNIHILLAMWGHLGCLSQIQSVVWELRLSFKIEVRTGFSSGLAIVVMVQERQERKYHIDCCPHKDRSTWVCVWVCSIEPTD